MILLSKTHDKDNPHDNTDVFMQASNDISLNDLLEMVEDYIRALRHSFKGHVTIIDDEEEQ